MTNDEPPSNTMDRGVKDARLISCSMLRIIWIYRFFEENLPTNNKKIKKMAPAMIGTNMMR
jgi:hypothetical protein